MGLINKINSYDIAWRELKARMGIVDHNPERSAAIIQACMKQLLLLLVLAILSGHKSICQERGHKPSFSIVADTNIGKQLLNQCSRAVPKNIDSFWTPADPDIKQLENNFEKIYSVSATECCWPGARIDSLKKYGFQYLGVIIRGQRYIYINAFPLGNKTWYEEHKKDLSKNALTVCDGGTSFWGVLFDTKRRTFSLLAFNGDA